MNETDWYQLICNEIDLKLDSEFAEKLKKRIKDRDSAFAFAWGLLLAGNIADQHNTDVLAKKCERLVKKLNSTLS